MCPLRPLVYAAQPPAALGVTPDLEAYFTCEAGLAPTANRALSLVPDAGYGSDTHPVEFVEGSRWEGRATVSWCGRELQAVAPFRPSPRWLQRQGFPKSQAHLVRQ